MQTPGSFASGSRCATPGVRLVVEPVGPRPRGGRSSYAATGSRSRTNACELSFVTSCPTCPERPVRGDEADLLLSGSPLRAARAAHRRAARSGPRAGRTCASSPTPSKTTTPRAPLSATKLASGSTSSRVVGEPARVEEVVAVEEVERRLSHAAGAARLVEQDGGRDADVERLDLAGERDRDRARRTPGGRAGGAPCPRRRARARRRREGRRLPDRRRRLGRGAPRPRVGPLHLVEIAREVRDDRDRKVLDGAGRGAADRRRHARRAVRREHDAGRAGALGAPARPRRGCAGR